MTILTIAVCDDNSEDGHVLKSHLTKILPGAEIKFFNNSEPLLELIEKKGNPYSAIFLSMDMQGISGIEAAKVIRTRDLFVPIIFTGSNSDFYKEAFEVFAYNYLLKPVSLETLEHVMFPLKYKWGEQEERMIHFRYRSQVFTIRHSQITYISSSLHTVNFHMADGSAVHCRGKLSDFDEQLKDSTFLRCHQSFYVNMEQINAMKNDSFTLKDGIVPISRSYSKEAHARYTDYLKERGNNN